jgi:hypothetical protein
MSVPFGGQGALAGVRMITVSVVLMRRSFMTIPTAKWPDRKKTPGVPAGWGSRWPLTRESSPHDAGPIGEKGYRNTPHIPSARSAWVGLPRSVAKPAESGKGVRERDARIFAKSATETWARCPGDEIVRRRDQNSNSGFSTARPSRWGHLGTRKGRGRAIAPSPSSPIQTFAKTRLDDRTGPVVSH